MYSRIIEFALNAHDYQWKITLDELNYKFTKIHVINIIIILQVNSTGAIIEALLYALQ